MVSGRKPDQERRRCVAELRRAGLTLQEIGRRLGITHQAVHYLLRARSRARPLEIRCAGCGAALDPAGALPRDAGSALCLACLAVTPGVPFGRRLKAYRLAAGLTRHDLECRAGLSVGKVSRYEDGGRVPSPPTLARLARALGVPGKALAANALSRKPRGRPRGGSATRPGPALFTRHAR